MALSIIVNGGTGDRTDLVQGSTVALTSNESGTYSWSLVSKPAASGAVLSGGGTASPSFVADVEGSYLVQLIINSGTALAQSATAVVAVREVETRERIPALGETRETGNWSQTAVDKVLQRAARLTDAGVIVGKVLAPNVPVAKDVVFISGKATVSVGTADERTVPVLKPAKADSYASVSGLLAVVQAAVSGGAIAANAYVRAIHTGLVKAVSYSGSAPSVDDPVFVDNDGKLSLTEGDVSRVVGRVVNVSSGTYDVAFAGQAGVAIVL